MERAVLIYDGDCAACRAHALLLMRRALSAGRLEILPAGSGPRRQRFPHVVPEACSGAMQLVAPDGRVLAAGDAVPELLRCVRGFAWLAAIAGSPALGGTGRRLRHWIARRGLGVVCDEHLPTPAR